MHQKQIIKEIETRFSRYYDSTSDTMLVLYNEASY